MRKLFFALLMCIMSLAAMADDRTLEEIRSVLEESSTRQVQEKVFVHTDNMCYFVGDTLWYKAYVVRADDLKFTDMSRLLYVELLSPDGIVVERQTVIVSNKGFGSGCFALTDSLYSGFYELRAYTRWMLNFNVTLHRYSRDDKFSFYNKQMAADFFRQWDGLYSRVLPVYTKPEQAGDYTYKRTYQRPKTRIQKPKKEDLAVNFYPEGGNLIEGLPNRVAFEVTNQLGEIVNIKGIVTAGDAKVADIATSHNGRGVFVVTPAGKRLRASFTWRGKEYKFNLPKAEEAGATMRVGEGSIAISSSQLPQDRKYGLSIICRGVLKHFQEVVFDASGKATITIPQLPTGVNDITLFDTKGQVLSDRLIFVNNHDYDGNYITVESEIKNSYSPYEQISVSVKAAGVTEPTNLSLAIRDTRTDEPTYNDGNMMTDLLLSSELKGFIANPAYYFEADDDKHRADLDLLMMVQGWRKYKWQELSDTIYMKRRYEPETTLTVEGSVYKMLSISEVQPEEIGEWKNGVGMVGLKELEEEATTTEAETTADEFYSTEDMSTTIETAQGTSNIEYGSIMSANSHLGVNHSNLRHEVLVEAEVILGSDIASSVQKTEKGRYKFQIPPFYGQAYLRMKAYKEKDSLKKNMLSRQDAKVMDEDAYPDYYVKRDMFYPRYSTKYSYYQDHTPDVIIPTITEEMSDLSMENDVHQLRNVDVKGKRRGRRAIDFTKPAFVCDAYDLYNDITDYGLSFGKFDMRQFPIQICKFLYGNMGRYDDFNVDGRVKGTVFYRNYSIADADPFGTRDFNKFTPYALYDMLKLKRMMNIRVYSDYEPRNEDSTMVSDEYTADATVEFELIPDDGKQPTSRDRRIVIKGINQPVQFYNPDYSTQQPAEPVDHRRTLYWNPNARTDEEGRFTATFYNNSKETRIKVNAAGLTSDGRMLSTK